MAQAIGDVGINLFANTASWKGDLDRAAGHVRGMRSKVNRSLARVEKGFLKVRRSVARTAKSFFSLRGAIGTLVGAAGLGLLVKRAVTAADVIAKTADAAGVSTKALQEYQFAAELSGISTEQFNKSLLQIGKRIGELRTRTDSELITSLKNFDAGLLANIRNAGSQEAALDLVFRKMGALRDQTKRLALATAVFGRAGLLMTNLVRDGAAGLDQMRERARALGLVIDERLLRAAEKTKDALAELAAVIRTQVFKAVLELGPGITVLAGDLVNLTIKLFKLTAQFAKFLGLIERSRKEVLQFQVKRFDQLLARGATIGTAFKNIDELVKARTKAATELKRIIETEERDRAKLTVSPKIQSVPTRPFVSAQAASKAAAALKRQEELTKSALENITRAHLRATDQIEALIERRRKAEIAALAKLKLSEQQLADAKIKINETFNAELMEQRQKRLDEVTEAAEKEMQVVNNVGQTVGSGIENALVNATTRGAQGFENLRDVALGVLQDIQRQMIRLLLFGKDQKGGLLGSAVSILGTAFSAVGSTNVNAGAVPSQGGGGFQHGGQFTVGGRTGTDNNFVGFNASRGEEVTVQTRAQQRQGGGGTVIHIDARGAEPGIEDRIRAVYRELEPGTIQKTDLFIRGQANLGGAASRDLGRRGR